MAGLQQQLIPASEGAMRPIKLVCPNCGSDSLATIEDLSGSAYGSAYEEKGERHFSHQGWTEVYWDSSETRGVECRDCQWRCTEDNYLEQLAVEEV